MTAGDDGDRDERPRLSWSEIDKRRDKARGRRDERRPRGAAAEARSRAATQQYLKRLDGQLFAKGTGRAASAPLADAVRAALGTPELAAACRAYLDAHGPPADPALLAAFLDARDRALQLEALRALADGVRGERIALTSGLRAQLRSLAEGLDDELAEAAEGILAGD